MNPYVYGYVRVSTQQQDLIRQLDLLKNYKCTEILTEKISGTKLDRPELNRLKDKVRSRDTLIVESFSRLGRSTKDLIELVEYFENKGVKLISLKESFDTNTPQGKLMLTVFQAFSQFERDLIAQRTKEGLESARARGRKGGRPTVKEKHIEKALNLYDSKQYSISEIVDMTEISQATLYRYIRKRGSNEEINRGTDADKTAAIRFLLRIEMYLSIQKCTKSQLKSAPLSILFSFEHSSIKKDFRPLVLLVFLQAVFPFVLILFPIVPFPSLIARSL